MLDFYVGGAVCILAKEAARWAAGEEVESLKVNLVVAAIWPLLAIASAVVVGVRICKRGLAS